MLSTEMLLTVAVICVGVCYWLKYHYNYWRRQNIPCMEPTPLLGDTKVMFTLSKNFGLHMSDIYNDKRVLEEPVVGIYTLLKPALLIRDLDIVKNILIRDFNKFANHYASADPHGDALGSNNIFFVNNPKWKAIRTKLTPVFTSGKIKQMYPLMAEIGKDLETHLAGYDKANARFITEIKEMCACFTTDLIATIAFGIKVNSLGNPNAKFRVEGRKMFDFTLGRAFDFFVAFFIPKLVTLCRVKVFPTAYTKMIRESMDHVMDERERSGKMRNDLIDILVAMKKEAELDNDVDNFARNKDFLLAQAAIFFSAGFESSSSTMSFALYELAKQPELQQRLRQEIHEALAENEGKISYEKIHNLEYLGMVLDEVLRLYPVLPFLDRQYVDHGSKGFSLQPQSSYKIPDGMAVFIPTFGIQRDPKYWPNPEQFDPERFSSENKKSMNPMTYLPFGAGPRNCIGSRVGLLQARIGLVHILKNHYVMTCDRTVKEVKFDPKAFMLQFDGGLYLEVVYDGLFEKNRQR